MFAAAKPRFSRGGDELDLGKLRCDHLHGSVAGSVVDDPDPRVARRGILPQGAEAPSHQLPRAVRDDHDLELGTRHRPMSRIVVVTLPLLRAYRVLTWASEALASMAPRASPPVRELDPRGSGHSRVVRGLGRRSRRGLGGWQRGAEVQQRAAPRPLRTAVLDPHSFSIASVPDRAVAFRRVPSTGARFVRLFVDWAAVAPGGATKPPGFDARNPCDPLYKWAGLDSELRQLASNGLTPIVYVQSAPEWAWGGACTNRSRADPPEPVRARRLRDRRSRSATAGCGLPRVRYWQVWNEPNLRHF